MWMSSEAPSPQRPRLGWPRARRDDDRVGPAGEAAARTFHLDRDTFADLGRLDGGPLAGRPGADDDELEAVHGGATVGASAAGVKDVPDRTFPTSHCPTRRTGAR
jgi:hypothetical protein